jgi:Rrf2 family protein
MRLTRAAYYALQAVVYMANQKKNRDDRPIASHTIAAQRRIPERFLLKVLKPLVAAQILHSIKGPNGGYRLARSPHEITMLEVVEAAEGGQIRGGAPVNPKDPDTNLHRRLDQVCSQLADHIRKQLGKVRISELASR